MYNSQSEYQLRSTPDATPPSNAICIDQPHGTDLVNKPIPYSTGQFAGKTMRAELHEVQKASLGRKYARVDRRPLDPPPVVRLRLFHVSNAGTKDETETEVCDYDEIDMLGLLCTVDLFPVHDCGRASPSNTPPSKTSHLAQDHGSATQGKVDDYTFATVPGTKSPLSVPRNTQSQMSSSSAEEIIHYVGDFPVRESSKITHALVGATFVQPASVEFQGEKCIMFVFADLAVKIEGTFILRYRTFDIFSKPQNLPDLAIQSQCYGDVFRVYSTKEFPGLQASTELTKQLARWGVRLNTRETERRRRKRSQQRSLSPLYTGTRMRKRSPPDTADERSGSEGCPRSV